MDEGVNHHLSPFIGVSVIGRVHVSAPVATHIVAVISCTSALPAFATEVSTPLLSAELAALTGLAFTPAVFLPIGNGFAAPLRLFALDQVSRPS
jgi:hypothetical protein